MMEQVGAARGQAMEATMDVGSLLVFDPMLSHQGSPFREGVTHAAGVGRYAQFQVWADDAAIGDSLAGGSFTSNRDNLRSHFLFEIDCV